MVPILGQPMILMTWYPTTLLRCNCKQEFEKKAILIIHGFGGASMCPLCGSKATINGILPDGQLDITVQTQDPIGRVQ